MNGMYVLLSNEFNSFNCNAFFKVLTSMLTINTERNKKNQNEHQHYLIQFLDNNLISVLIVIYLHCSKTSLDEPLDVHLCSYFHEQHRVTRRDVIQT